MAWSARYGSDCRENSLAAARVWPFIRSSTLGAKWKPVEPEAEKPGS